MTAISLAYDVMIVYLIMDAACSAQRNTILVHIIRRDSIAITEYMPLGIPGKSISKTLTEERHC